MYYSTNVLLKMIIRIILKKLWHENGNRSHGSRHAIPVIGSPGFCPYIWGRYGRSLGALPRCPDQAVPVSAPPRQTGSQRRTLCQ